MVLADNGAQVLRVERPGGGRDRDRPGLAVWHRSKSIVELDLADPDARRSFDELLDDADGVVVALSEATADRLGLAHERVATGRPSLVDVRISGFGRGGPLSHLPGL